MAGLFPPGCPNAEQLRRLVVYHTKDLGLPRPTCEALDLIVMLVNRGASLRQIDNEMQYLFPESPKTIPDFPEWLLKIAAPKVLASTSLLPKETPARTKSSTEQRAKSKPSEHMKRISENSTTAVVKPKPSEKDTGGTQKLDNSRVPTITVSSRGRRTRRESRAVDLTGSVVEVTATPSSSSSSLSRDTSALSRGSRRKKTEEPLLKTCGHPSSIPSSAPTTLPSEKIVDHLVSCNPVETKMPPAKCDDKNVKSSSNNTDSKNSSSKNREIRAVATDDGGCTSDVFKATKIAHHDSHYSSKPTSRNPKSDKRDAAVKSACSRVPSHENIANAMTPELLPKGSSHKSLSGASSLASLPRRGEQLPAALRPFQPPPAASEPPSVRERQRESRPERRAEGSAKRTETTTSDKDHVARRSGDERRRESGTDQTKRRSQSHSRERVARGSRSRRGSPRPPTAAVGADSESRRRHHESSASSLSIITRTASAATAVYTDSGARRDAAEHGASSKSMRHRTLAAGKERRSSLADGGARAAVAAPFYETELIDGRGRRPVSVKILSGGPEIKELLVGSTTTATTTSSRRLRSRSRSLVASAAAGFPSTSVVAIGPSERRDGKKRHNTDLAAGTLCQSRSDFVLARSGLSPLPTSRRTRKRGRTPPRGLPVSGRDMEGSKRPRTEDPTGHDVLMRAGGAAQIEQSVLQNHARRLGKVAAVTVEAKKAPGKARSRSRESRRHRDAAAAVSKSDEMKTHAGTRNSGGSGSSISGARRRGSPPQFGIERGGKSVPSNDASVGSSRDRDRARMERTGVVVERQQRHQQQQQHQMLTLMPNEMGDDVAVCSGNGSGSASTPVASGKGGSEPEHEKLVVVGYEKMGAGMVPEAAATAQHPSRASDTECSHARAHDRTYAIQEYHASLLRRNEPYNYRADVSVDYLSKAAAYSDDYCTATMQERFMGPPGALLPNRVDMPRFAKTSMILCTPGENEGPSRCRHWPFCYYGISGRQLCKFWHPVAICTFYPNCPHGDENCHMIHPKFFPLLSNPQSNMHNMPLDVDEALERLTISERYKLQNRSSELLDLLNRRIMEEKNDVIREKLISEKLHMERSNKFDFIRNPLQQQQQLQQKQQQNVISSLQLNVGTHGTNIQLPANLPGPIGAGGGGAGVRYANAASSGTSSQMQSATGASDGSGSAVTAACALGTQGGQRSLHVQEQHQRLTASSTTISNVPCKFGVKCTRRGCPYVHPHMADRFQKLTEEPLVVEKIPTGSGWNTGSGPDWMEFDDLDVYSETLLG